MEVGYIPLYTKVRYQGREYETDSACSRAFGTIRIMGDGPHASFFVKVSELEEIKLAEPQTEEPATYQYLLKVNDTERYYETDAEISILWPVVCAAAEARGDIIASLKRRRVCKPGETRHTALSKGWIVVDENTVVGPWENIAECDGRHQQLLPTILP